METPPEVAAAEQPSPNAPETTTEPTPEAIAPEPKTVGEILNEQPQVQPNLVPEAALISEKKGRKEAEKRAKELEQQLADLQRSASKGATKAEVSDDINSIMTEFGIDETNRSFLTQLVSAVERKSTAEIETLKSQITSLGEESKRKAFDTAFQTHFDAAMDNLPDYQGKVNPSVIKALTLDPANKDKTFEQIIEDAYGDAIPGKRTVETTRPGGVKEPEPIDFVRAKTDQAYLEEILSNPTTKAEYNKSLHRRIGV